MTWLIETVGYALTTATFGILWILLAARSISGHRQILLLIAPMVTVIWAGTNMGTNLFDIPREWTGPLQMLHTIGWLFVIHQLLDRSPAATIRERIIIAGIALMTAVGSIGIMLTEDESGLFVALFGGGMCLLQVAGLMMLENIVRNANTQRLWALKHLLLGCATIQIFDLILFAEVLLFGSYDPTYKIAQGYVDAIAAPLIAISVMRHRSWQMDLHVSREVVYQSTVLILSGGYLLAVAGAGYYLKQFGGDWGTISAIVLIIVALVSLVIMMSSASARARLRLWIGSNFFSHKYDYRREWLRFTDKLSDSSTDATFHQRLIYSIGDIVDSTGGAFWLHHPDDKAFALECSVNMGDELRALPENHPLPRYLRAEHKFIDLRHYTQSSGEEQNLSLPTWLTDNKRAWLILPLVHMESLIGFVVLARSRVPHDLDREDNDLLRVVCQQVASYAAEERSMRTLEDAKRLEAFNKRFAFVVHDLKNAISQLSMMLKNAEKHASNPEFQKDMLNTVENTVERMKNMMERMKADSEGQTGPAVRKSTLPVVLQAAHASWSKKIEHLSLSLDDQSCSYSVEDEKMHNVLDHLINNAAEAAGPEGHIKIGLTQDSQSMNVHITDNGPGMSPEFIREKLFRPLNTSKKGGFGIGAYQVQQLVREMGGHLEVQSSPGEGTTMTIQFFDREEEGA